MSKVVIFGSSSMAEVVHFYLTHDSKHEVVAFTVNQDHIETTKKELLGKPIVPYETLTKQYPPDQFSMYVAVGYKNNNQVRAQICEESRKKGYKLVSYVSSRCTHWGDTEIGDNCFIFENNTLQPYVKIGNNVILWSGNHIGHHSQIEDNCFITSHVVVSGNVRVGKFSFIGVNATLRDSITIGQSNIIGAGSIIMKSTKDRELYITKRTYPDNRTTDEVSL